MKKKRQTRAADPKDKYIASIMASMNILYEAGRIDDLAFVAGNAQGRASVITMMAQTAKTAAS